MMFPFDQTLIIIPTYNEINNIRLMVHSIFSINPEISLLIIDDGSPDGTAEEIKRLQQEVSQLYLIQRQKKLGLGTAYTTGFKWALERDYQYIIEMDCDFSHDPKDIQKLLEMAQENDLVIGSRYINGIRILNWPLKRLLLSTFASFYARFITGIPIKDPMGGFKCFRRKALESLNLNKIMFKGYAFQIELNYKIWRKGLRIKEIPIIFSERREGASKMNKSLIIEAIFGVFKLKIRQIFRCLN